MSMLETRAIVIRIEGAEAVVEAGQGGGCGLCGGKGGCGSSKLSQLFCTQPRQFRVRNEAGVCVGDEVQVSMAEGALLRGAAMVYLLPLLLLLAGGGLGSYWAGDNPVSHDIWAACGALIGLAAGFALARQLALRQRLAGARPVISARDTGAAQLR